jgi:sugar diacid utilization regulator
MALTLSFLDDPRVGEQLSSTAARMGVRLGELTEDIQGFILESIPALRDDDRVTSMLEASVQQNVDTMLHVLRHGLETTRIDAPAAAVEYARRLAQRDVPPTALIRAYRVGQTRFLRRCMENLLQHTSGDHVEGATTLRMVERTSDYVDEIVEQVIAAYEQAREEWLQHRGAVLSGWVRSLLQERDVNVELAESKLGGYRLRQHHLGVVIWTADHAGERAPISTLRALADALAQAAGCRERPLFVARDESSAWVWLPLGSRTTVAREALEKVLTATPGGQARAALGEPAAAVEGFRRTQRQALSAQLVALASTRGRPALTPFIEVAPIAMMCADLEATRDWVAETLGGLAVDDERHSMLRETARVFLASGGSYATTAEQLTLHRNTAQYRVRKAEELRGRPLREGRLDVELALLACHWLGRAVLRSA